MLEAVIATALIALLLGSQIAAIIASKKDQSLIERLDGCGHVRFLGHGSAGEILKRRMLRPTLAALLKTRARQYELYYT